MCDIVRWDGHDPHRLDPANPMHDVFAIYADRQILEHDQLGEPVVRSKPGAPVPPERGLRSALLHVRPPDRGSIHADVADDDKGQPEPPALPAHDDGGGRAPSATRLRRGTPSSFVNDAEQACPIEPTPITAPAADEYALPLS
ncbi:hypothetical protein AB5I41_28910 [Sphingomonas sp. MMS24-JH45]